MMEWTRGPAREVLDKDEIEKLVQAGALVTDERRRRPLYFDGRFLAARDLTRDQNYFLTRQADLGRAGGAGVVQGLRVTPVSGSAAAIHLEAGHGITPSGELVVLPAPCTIDLANVPEIQRLDAAFGLLRLPPIDLTLPAEQLESTAILILIAVPRQRVRHLKSTLTSLTHPLIPAAPGLVAMQKPLEILRGLRLPRLPERPAGPAENTVDTAWRQELAGADLLWYVRRRNLHYKADVVGSVVPVLSDEMDGERMLDTRIEELGLRSKVGELRRRTSAAANAEIVAMLSSPKFTRSHLLMGAAVHALDSAQPEPIPRLVRVMREPEMEAITSTPGPDRGTPEPLNRITILKVAERFADPQMGEGMLRMEATNSQFKEDPKIIEALVQSGLVPELDRVGRQIKDADLPDFAAKLVEAARGGEIETIKELIQGRMK